MRSPRFLHSVFPVAILAMAVGPIAPSGVVPYLAIAPALAQTTTDLPTDLPSRAQQLLEQGNRQLDQGQIDAAIASWQDALALFRQQGDSTGQAKALANLGFAALALGRYDDGIVFYQQVLALARAVDNPTIALNALAHLGQAYDAVGDYSQAVESYQAALSLAQSLGNRAGEGAIAGGLALAYEQLGNNEQASRFYQLMLQIAEALGDRETANVARSSLTRTDRQAETQLPDAPPAVSSAEDELSAAQQALAIARQTGDRRTEALLLGNMGRIYLERNQLIEAVDAFQASLAIAQELDDPRLMQRSWLNLATLYLLLGQFERALSASQDLLTLAQEQGDRAGQGAAWQGIGSAHFYLGNMSEAIVAHQTNLDIQRGLADPSGEAIALATLGEAYLGIGDTARALEYLQAAVAIAQTLPDPEAYGVMLGTLGTAYAIAGDYEDALAALQQSLAFEQASQTLLGEATVLNNLGTTFYLAGELEQAVDYLQRSLALWEEQRANVAGNDVFQISIFETQQQAYQTLQQVLVAQGETEQALVTAEQGRTQALVALLSNRQTNQTLSNSFDISLDRIQQIAHDHNATLVQYSISYKPAELFIPGVEQRQFLDADLLIWVVQPTGDIEFRQVPITTPLRQIVADARRSLGVSGGRGGGFAYDSPDGNEHQRLQDLYQLLVAPIADLLPDEPSDRVIFIPQGELFLVPFAALQDQQGTYLIQQHTILTAPSIQVLGLIQQRETQVNRELSNRELLSHSAPIQPEDVLIVGNPAPMPTLPALPGETPEILQPLAGAQQEAQAIAQEIFNTQALIGSAATEAAVKDRLSRSRIIHLATHGLLDYGTLQETYVLDVPGAIALVSTADQDGLLTASELADISLQADLVVLSACDTGQGNIRGDGVVGLSRSLLLAGTPSVIVSLWSVPDAPTAALMVEFYRQWQQEGLDKAQALRQAMLATMATHPDPNDWAAFTLIGEAE